MKSKTSVNVSLKTCLLLKILETDQVNASMKIKQIPVKDLSYWFENTNPLWSINGM